MFSKSKSLGHLQNKPYFQTYISCYLCASVLPCAMFWFKLQSSSEGIKTGGWNVIYLLRPRFPIHPWMGGSQGRERRKPAAQGRHTPVLFTSPFCRALTPSSCFSRLYHPALGWVALIAEHYTWQEAKHAPFGFIVKSCWMA